MIRRKAAISAVLLTTLLLSGCSSSTPPSEERLQVSGAKSAIAFMHLVAKRSIQSNRPSGPLGVFSGLYLAHGAFLPVSSAVAGLANIATIQVGQTNSTSDENFALLREVGDVLQINIVDMLNRSPSRLEALDTYTQSLNNAGILTERKLEELNALHDTQKDKVKEQRKVVRDIESNLREALRKPDYQAASEYEEQLAGAKVTYTEMQTSEEQTGDMIDRFETLLEIAEERIQAVEHNREILIAGLRVIDLPGIADLNILEKGKPWRKRKAGSIFDKPRGTL